MSGCGFLAVCVCVGAYEAAPCCVGGRSLRQGQHCTGHLPLTHDVRWPHRGPVALQGSHECWGHLLYRGAGPSWNATPTDQGEPVRPHPWAEGGCGLDWLELTLAQPGGWLCCHRNDTRNSVVRFGILKINRVGTIGWYYIRL